jgi:hypothetical protein
MSKTTKSRKIESRIPEWVTHEIDARIFQKPLADLTNTLSLKVEREGSKIMKPNFAAIDIYMMLRQALRTYDLFFYLNADERRKNDIYWNVGYSAAILPLIICMIDCLYNVTAILDKPGPRGYQFRESGYQLALKALEDDEKKYGGDPRWGKYNADRRKFLDIAMQSCGITLADVQAAKIWPTLSGYLRLKEKCCTDAPPSIHKESHAGTLAGIFWDGTCNISGANGDRYAVYAKRYSLGVPRTIRKRSY